MSVSDPIEQLDEEACWAQLAQHEVGRLAVCIAGEPEIVPVNFVRDGDALVFRTAEGGKLFAAALEAAAVFEVDRWDDDGATSVVARGTLRELTTGEELDHASSLPLRPFVDTVTTHFVRLQVAGLTGRRFRFHPPVRGA